MRHTFENISANLFIRMITYLFSFLTVAYAARILQPEAFGRISFVSSFTGYIAILSKLGIYGTRLCAERKDKQDFTQTVSELWCMNLFLSFISILLLTALVIIVPRFRQERILFLIYGSGILLQTIGFEWLFRGLERFKFLAVCQLVAKVISFILMIVFIHSSDQLPLYAGLSVATNYGGDLICFFAARKYIHSFHHIFRVAELKRVVSHERSKHSLFRTRIWYDEVDEGKRNKVYYCGSGRRVRSAA